MTACENPASEPMAGAAAQRPDPARQPGQTAIRAKPARVTDLDPATYTELNRWAGSAAIAVNPDFPRLPPTRRSAR
jgi:hypothetical protein